MSLLYSALKHYESHIPERIALQGDDVSVTYRQLLGAVAEKESLLAKQNVRVLGLQLPNGIDWMLWDLAALKSGITCIPLPPFFTPEQTAYVVRSAGIDMISTLGGLKPTGVAPVSIPHGTAKITFTSGTTGTPKGVCLSALAMENVAKSIADILGPDFAKNHLSVMPLPILLENVAGIYAALIAGATITIPSAVSIGMSNPFQPDIQKLAQTIYQGKMTSIILVPELLRGLVYVAQKDASLLSSLTFIAVGGSKVSPGLIHAARALGLPVYEGYGLSECGSVVSLNTPNADFTGTVGKVLPHIKASIADSEIIIESQGFLGYLGDSPRTSTLFSTGDIGRFDDNGALHIDGRKKNIIITSHGRNISPEWVESILLTQPEILQAIIYGDELPQPEAIIVPSSHNGDIAAAIERTNNLLPAYAQIGAFVVVPPFTIQDGTLTGTGRPKREAILARTQLSQTPSHITSKEKTNDVLQQAG